MAGITIEYECADGTPFPVQFADAEQAAGTWRLDRGHSPDPVTPLDDALGRIGRLGTERAYREAGLVVPSDWRQGPQAGGFQYYSEQPADPDEDAALLAGCGVLVQRYGGALEIWLDFALPNVRAACDELDRADATVSIAALSELTAYAAHMTHVPAYVLRNDIDRLEAACPPMPGLDPRFVALQLTQGYECETLRADAELWELGRLVRKPSAVMRAIEDADPPRSMALLRDSGESREFFAAVDRFLSQFGRRTESWDIACPTWNEQGPGFWAQLGQMASEKARDPRQVIAAGAQRRLALVARLSEQLAGEPDTLARFERLVERAAPYVAVREERAFWQLVTAGSLRHALLRRGAALVEQGRIDHAADVLYLDVDEVEHGKHDLRAVVHRRRAEHERKKTLTPPTVIGGEVARRAAHPVLPADSVIRGLGASHGVASGRARLVLDLADAHRVDPGDVLVCVMTAPPWTPLFGIAGAIVTDSGGLGSHAAIAAREYGIPAVVGTSIATAVIPDGAFVTVDGTAGTVHLS